MRLGLVAAAIVAAVVSVPAEAVTVVRADVQASGTTVYPPCAIYSAPNCDTTVPVTRSFSFEVDATSLGIGSSLGFFLGPNSNAGTYRGTITRTGTETFAGTDFSFLSSQAGTGPTGIMYAITTSLSAPTFAVTQIFPAPVPEPTTWAMMLFGFGGMGAAMRRRKKITTRVQFA